VIGAIVPTLANPVHAEALQAATNVLAAAGYQVLLGATGYSERRELELVRTLLGHRVDGLVVTGVQHAADCAALLAGCGLPVVETFDLAERPIDLNVGFSNHAAGVALTRHLLARGRRRLVFVEHADADDSRMRARRDGFLEACRGSAALEVRVLATPGDPTTADAARVVEAVLAAMPLTDAILFAGHQLAAGAIHHLTGRGIAVPDRIAVAGFGDSPVARWVRPDLTTIRFPMARMGEEAARLLLARLAGAAPAARRADLGFELVVRASG
jgi:LacI family gluconate utilization system Gnt-I transcriptional repressor